MARTYVLHEAYDKLEVVTKELGVETAPMIGYLIEDHGFGLGLDNTYLVDDYEKLSLDFVRAVTVSRRAAYIAAERASSFGIKIASFVSFIVFDNLPSLESLPDSFPGVRELQSGAKTRRKGGFTTVNVTDRVYNWLKRRQTVINGGIPLSFIVSTILQSVPYKDVLSSVSGEDFAKHLDEEYSAANLHSVRVPIDVHTHLVSVSNRLGIAQWRLASFLLMKDLEASEIEVTTNSKLLPTNIRDRWTVLLKEFLELDD